MNKPTILFTLMFIEGSCVMLTELIGGKLIAPYFGSSLYVWAAILAISLLGLMLGYLIGGRLSEKHDNERLLSNCLSIAALGIIAMPYTAKFIIPSLLSLNIYIGTSLSLLLIVFPILFLLGMSSPVVVNILNKKLDQSGKKAGSIYAISTLGGIFSTYLVGFYLLPTYGIIWPCFVFGLVLILLPLFNLLKSKRYISILYVLPFVLVFLSGKNQKLNRNILYASEGVFGQIKVFDTPYSTALRGMDIARILSVNNVEQSSAYAKNLKYDIWDWSYYFPTVASIFPKNSEALLLGLGGGTIVHQYNRLGFNLDVVEIDERIKDVAINFFDVDSNTNIIIDDGRHYLNVCQKQYDLITFDTFLNETPPSHLLTKESFKKVYALLNPEGMVILNFFGHTSGEEGAAARALLKTLQDVGFIVEILPTPSKNEGDRNIIFLASKIEQDFTKINYSEPGLPKISNLRSYFLNMDTIDLTNAEILSDTKPSFDKMYTKASIYWRKRIIDYNLKTRKK